MMIKLGRCREDQLSSVESVSPFFFAVLCMQCIAKYVSLIALQFSLSHFSFHRSKPKSKKKTETNL